MATLGFDGAVRLASPTRFEPVSESRTLFYPLNYGERRGRMLPRLGGGWGAQGGDDNGFGRHRRACGQAGGQVGRWQHLAGDLPGLVAAAGFVGLAWAALLAHRVGPTDSPGGVVGLAFARGQQGVNVAKGAQPAHGSTAAARTRSHRAA